MDNEGQPMTSTEKQRPGKGRNPNSLKNLQPFKKGESGNPKGRPKREDTLTSCLWAEVEKPHRNTGETKMQAFARIWVAKALEGDVVLMKELRDVLDGKANQPVSGDMMVNIVSAIPRARASEQSEDKG